MVQLIAGDSQNLCMTRRQHLLKRVDRITHFIDDSLSMQSELQNLFTEDGQHCMRLRKRALMLCVLACIRLLFHALHHMLKRPPIFRSYQNVNETPKPLVGEVNIFRRVEYRIKRLHEQVGLGEKVRANFIIH